MSETILIDVQNNIMTITLNRPSVLNAFNEQMLEELLKAYKQADENDEVRVVIVTGSGRAFCSGSDLSGGVETFSSEKSADNYRDTGGKLSLQVYNLKKPVIAAINGTAVGVGITMTLPMDIRIFTKGAKLGFVFGRRGIGPEACSGWFLPKIVGIGKALEWVLTGRMISTEEAHSSGLVNYVVEDALEKALEIAGEIVANTSSVSNAFSRQLLWHMLGTESPANSHLFESKFLHWAGNQADAKEGVAAFIEKRTPTFNMSVNEMPDFIKKS
ncbi:enoyl-CoA hydratase-related protein [Metabacillus herbersteinensis]|uniref:Enoyl-CoA hydratase-related protein n=1 Tax=Metabacillus herbersteinensis TaxID=283816 RepID=A0ABV6GFQ8_9BACI